LLPTAQFITVEGETEIDEAWLDYIPSMSSTDSIAGFPLDNLEQVDRAVLHFLWHEYFTNTTNHVGLAIAFMTWMNCPAHHSSANYIMVEVEGMEGCRLLPHSGTDSAIPPEQLAVTVYDPDYFNIYVKYAEYLETPGALWEEIGTYSGMVKTGPQQNKFIAWLSSSEQKHFLMLINLPGWNIPNVFREHQQPHSRDPRSPESLKSST
jgi:hypothetical protein